MASSRSVSAQRKTKAQKSQTTRKTALPKNAAKPAANTSNMETGGRRKRILTSKACEFDILDELATSEDKGNDTDFFPAVIPLPDSDDTFSSTESDEPVPAPAQAPPKHGRGRPPKTQAAAAKGNVFVVDFLSCRTHFTLQNLLSGSLQVVPMVLGG